MKIDDRGKATKAVVVMEPSREPKTIIVEMISATIDALLNIDRLVPSCVWTIKKRLVAWQTIARYLALLEIATDNPFLFSVSCFCNIERADNKYRIAAK